MAGDAGLILACAGCCCGHPSHGGALAPQRALKAAMRRAYTAAGLEGRVRLAFTDCLGPCSEANVVLVWVHGRPLWLRRINTPELLATLMDFAGRAAADGRPALPAALAPHSFTWTGGGTGPAPPITDAAPRT